VFGREPDLTREGGSIPIANMFEDITGMNVMLLPVGACDDGAHSQNEKFDRVNYQNGIKVRRGSVVSTGRVGLGNLWVGKEKGDAVRRGRLSFVTLGATAIRCGLSLRSFDTS
jgi:hypothetical protein